MGSPRHLCRLHLHRSRGLGRTGHMVCYCVMTSLLSGGWMCCRQRCCSYRRRLLGQSWTVVTGTVPGIGRHLERRNIRSVAARNHPTQSVVTDRALPTLSSSPETTYIPKTSCRFLPQDVPYWEKRLGPVLDVATVGIDSISSVFKGLKVRGRVFVIGRPL